ncbi:probable F-box protein At3g56670 [Brassica napus]|uniref:probable F-box protein At3g56670 n=1 Tax=Brassica napus TaxID=3708 RepID=UPI0006AA67FB|nr:probable F-box protein At3g56670 [Brassica napus]
MKRGRKEKSHDTSTSSTRLRQGGDINLPLDLMVEILKKLPAKSLIRFRCVSKLWSSIISRSRDFIDSMVTRSLTEPPRDAHIIDDFAAGNYKKCYLAFSSSTFPRNTNEVSVLLMPERMEQYIRGLILCWSISRNKAAIYNPTTRQCFNLPDTKIKGIGSCFFGYDPLGNQYKALYIPLNYMEHVCQVFTLGDPTATQWRSIQGVKSHFPMASVVCINGVIYYRAINADATSEYKLMSFDVRWEKFYHVEAPKTFMDHPSILINYQGKLGFVCCEEGIEIWVMENANKETTQGWSMIFFYEMEGFKRWRILGATRGSEIVFVQPGYLSSDKLWVLYYDPKQNSMRYVDLKGTYPEEKRGYTSTIIWSALDYVDNTMCLYQAIS